MKISFYKNGYIEINRDDSYTEPVTVNWETTPASGHPDCLFCRDLEFDETKQTIEFDPGTEKITIKDNPIIEKSEAEKKTEIGDKILSTVFEGNPYAQLADLTKSQIVTLALLTPILGKETVRMAYSDLITKLKRVSEVRVAEWLAPFDLSFLDEVWEKKSL
jgi:hypothetical protein